MKGFLASFSGCLKTFIKLRLVLLTSLLMVVLIGWSVPILPVLAVPNPQINYQGKLADSDGATVPDGDYNIVFSLYTAAEGGTPVWTETHCWLSPEPENIAANSESSVCVPEDPTFDYRIPVMDGLFSVMLGSLVPLTSVNFNQPLYLGVRIEGSGAYPEFLGEEEMSPRRPLGTVSAAFEADKLDGLNSTQFLRSDAVNTISTTTGALRVNQTGSGDLINLQGSGTSLFKILKSGDTAVGTSTPSARLSVWGAGTGTGRLLELANSASTTVASVLDNGTAYFLGNVGIGTTSPYAKLSVSGQTAADYFTATNLNATSTFQGDVEIADGSRLRFRDGGQYLRSGLSGALTVSAENLEIDSTITTMFGNLFVNGSIETTLGLNLIGSTNNLFSISDDLGPTELFRVNAQDGIVTMGSYNGLWTISNAQTTYTGGNVGIGTTTPVSTLSIQGSLCVRDTGSCGTTAGTIYATTASLSDIDLAENLPTTDGTLEPGELVAVDRDNPEHIKRAETGDVVLGIVSTKPGLLLGQGVENGKPVALSGRVPVKVNDEGGEIRSGDYLALSSEPGVARKAAGADAVTVGVALQDFSGTSGVVVAFVNLNHRPLSGQIEGEQLAGDLSWLEEDMLRVRSLAGVTGAWSLDEDGLLIAKEIRTEKLCLGNTCINESKLHSILDKLNLLEGGDDDQDNQDNDTPPAEPDLADPVDPAVVPEPAEEEEVSDPGEPIEEPELDSDPQPEVEEAPADDPAPAEPES